MVTAVGGDGGGDGGHEERIRLCRIPRALETSRGQNFRTASYEDVAPRVALAQLLALAAPRIAVNFPFPALDGDPQPPDREDMSDLSHPAPARDHRAREEKSEP